MHKIFHSYKSPNYDERHGSVDMLVIHATNMAKEPSLARLCDPASKVSCHYVVTQNGEIYSLVDDQKRAWHAGQSAWRGREQINNYSIGIEIVNPNHLLPENKFTNEQMEAVIELCLDLITKYKIQPYNIVAHSDIAPSRKDDPGQYFDWKLMAERGVGIWLSRSSSNSEAATLHQGDSGEEVREVKRKLYEFGYKITQDDKFDQEMADIVVAFKRRFYQHDLAPSLDQNTLGILQQL